MPTALQRNSAAMRRGEREHKSMVDKKLIVLLFSEDGKTGCRKKRQNQQTLEMKAAFGNFF